MSLTNNTCLYSQIFCQNWYVKIGIYNTSTYCVYNKAYSYENNYKDKTTLYLVRVIGILVGFTIMISDDYNKFCKPNRY